MLGGVIMEKKPFYKRKSVWIIAAIIILLAAATSNSSTTTPKTEIAENGIASTPQVTEDVNESKDTKAEEKTNNEKKQKNETAKPETTPVDIENMSEEEQEKFLSDLTNELNDTSAEYEAGLEEELIEDSKVYRTDEDGSIMFKIKNNKLEVETCSP